MCEAGTAEQTLKYEQGRSQSRSIRCGCTVLRAHMDDGLPTSLCASDIDEDMGKR